MQVFHSLDEIKDQDIDETVIALGNFDGVHKGHQELIRRTVKSANMAGLKSAVFTFDNHPRNVFAGEPIIKNILYNEDKIAIIEELGIDYLFSIEFNEQIQHLSPKDYIEKLLVGTLRMKEAYCGFNHSFGYRAKGNPEYLIKAGIRDGFGIHVLEPFEINGQLVSSTLIRNLISRGQVDECEEYMGRRYVVGGEVVVGNRIGRTIGFPTSNILIDETMVTPSHGVYITCCIHNGVRHKSVTNVGIKPTIGDNKKTIETHIFDFDKELYGKHIRVEFLKKIRDEIKFGDREALSEQIRNDCLTAKEYHGLVD